MVLAPRNCCFFLSLKKGTLIIGVLEIIAGLGYLIGGSIRVANAPNSWLRPPFAFIAVGSLMIASGILLLLSAVVLLVGALKDKATLLVPWMVYMLTFIVTNSFLKIIAAAQDIEAWHQYLGDANAVLAAVVFLFQLYFLFVVNGLYTELKGTAPPNHTTNQSASRPWTTFD